MAAEYLQPFVLPTKPTEAQRRGSVDFYFPAGDGPRPAVLFVHGGPVTPTMRLVPRDWPAFIGYGQAMAERGVVGAVLDHRLHDLADYSASEADLADAVDALRTDPRVDADRIAIWFFSGGGPLSSRWLDASPETIRCLAFTYPLFGGRPRKPVDPRFQPVAALAGWQGVPIVLVRAGLEAPPVAATVAEFLAAAEQVDVQVIDVPNGRHGFDFLDDTDESRAALVEAFDAVLGHLGG
ncbi:MAG TPA: hypothetical protein VHZ97_21950 [Pseudonocardiaceae bacterium]|jgi:dienelactone hydrolase|nr:hypothetical protein [Pseudonocardiaceae bacterium]